VIVELFFLLKSKERTVNVVKNKIDTINKILKKEYDFRNIEHLDEPFLFIDKYISFMNEAEGEHFLKNVNEEVSAELFINQKCKGEKL
jgi:hypothetical protein